MSDDLFALFSALDDTPVVRESYLRAPYPYIGGKSRSVQELEKHLPYDDVWVDAFGGSGAVTLMRRPSKLEVFNDRHAGIVSFYRCIRDKKKLDELVQRLELTVHSREEFIWCKETWEYDAIDDVERAARWYYMQAFSFGGKGRYFGRSLKPLNGSFASKIRDNLVLFHDIHHRFSNVQVENSDWRLILKDYDGPNTVFYLDPPYYEKNCYQHNMSKADHIELCERIFKSEGFVALSGYDNPIYNNYPWDRKIEWSSHVTITTRAIETDTTGVTELGSNNNIECLWIKEYA